MLSFYLSAKDPNSGPHACWANTLPTKPCPSPITSCFETRFYYYVASTGLEFITQTNWVRVVCISPFSVGDPGPGISNLWRSGVSQKSPGWTGNKLQCPGTWVANSLISQKCLGAMEGTLGKDVRAMMGTLRK